MKKRIILKISAGIAALLLIAGVLSFANSLVGNPITKSMASKDIKEYLASEYQGQTLRLDDVSYNFKFNQYVGHISSPSSIDTRFTVEWRNGEIEYDSYEFSVTRRENTVQRYEKEASSQVSALLNDSGIPDIAKCNVVFCKEYTDTDVCHSLILDSPYDKTLSLPMELWIDYDGRSPSLEEYTKLLTQIHSTLKDHGYRMEFYTIQNYDATDVNLVLAASDISSDVIESGNLLSLLTAALESSDGSIKPTETSGSSSQRQIYVSSYERK